MFTLIRSCRHLASLSNQGCRPNVFMLACGLGAASKCEGRAMVGRPARYVREHFTPFTATYSRPSYLRIEHESICTPSPHYHYDTGTWHLTHTTQRLHLQCPHEQTTRPTPTHHSFCSTFRPQTSCMAASIPSPE